MHFSSITKREKCSSLVYIDMTCGMISLTIEEKGKTNLGVFFLICSRSVADIFRIQVISNTDVRSPIVTLGSTSFFHVRHENLYIVAVTKWNANASLIFEFCYRVVNIGRSYFGKFDEEAVKNNFVLIYELLDGKEEENSYSCQCIYSNTLDVRNSRLWVSSK